MGKLTLEDIEVIINTLVWSKNYVERLDNRYPKTAARYDWYSSVDDVVAKLKATIDERKQNASKSKSDRSK